MSALLVAGCQTPFNSHDDGRAFQRSIDAAVDREISALADANVDEPLALSRVPNPVEEALSARREELEKIGPYDRAQHDAFDIGPGLLGSNGTNGTVSLALDEAVATAVRNNFGVRNARLGPAISEADRIVAEAAFDYVLFGSAQFTKTDQPSTVPVIGGIPIGTPFTASEAWRFETGVRRRIASTGGEVSLSTDVNRFVNRAPGISFSPDPAITSAVRLRLTQPLLRGFGSDVNRAEIRIAVNAQGRAVEVLRSDLLTTIAEAEQAYWNLVFAWEDVAIQQWLVDLGTEVRQIVKGRQGLDANTAELADAIATVETRKANVIRARRTLRAASDALKVILNDPELNVASEAVIQPSDNPPGSPIDYSLRDAITTAMMHRPEIRQAILNIEDAGIRQILADNARLPLLNLSAEMAYFGLDDEVDNSFGDLNEGQFIDYIVGINFEQAIGNRAADAAYRQSRLQRSQSLIAYRQAVQNVILDVKNALRDVVTNYELIGATRSSRIAQAENLRQLRIRGVTTDDLNPAFLDLRFRQQESLAAARQQELQAQVNFDQSLASLYRAIGVSLDMRGINVDITEIQEADTLVNEALDWPARNAGDG